jgi:hypothetical protein
VDDIQPVAGPALSIARRGQQPIHQPLVSERRLVGLELGRFLGRGRQAVQVKLEAAQQGAPVRLGRGSKLQLLELGQHKGIDRVAHPGIGHGGRLHVGQRRQRPPWLLEPPILQHHLFWPGCPRGDPLLERLHFGGRQRRTVLGHQRLAARDVLQEQTFRHVAWQEGWAAIAAAQCSVSACQIQPPLGFFSVVARNAATFQDSTRRGKRLLCPARAG